MIEALRRLPIFADLPPELLRQVADHACRRQVAAGEVICAAGEPGIEFFSIDNGLVRIVASGSQGEEEVAELGPGEWFGEMALITGEPRSATAIAAVDTMLVVLTRDEFQQLVADLPGLAFALSQVLSRRLRAHLQRRHSRRPPGLVVILVRRGHAGDLALVLNLAAALGEQLADSFVLIDRFEGARLKAAAGNVITVPIFDVLPPDLLTLRAAHRLTLIGMRDDAPEVAEVLRAADAVWIAGEATPPAAPPEGAVTRIELGARNAIGIGDVVHLRDAMTRSATILRDAPRSVDAQALRRFARRVLCRSVGLALGAGGAKGLAHAGVLRSLERAGIEVDLLAGTSMGGIVGGFFACGRDSADLIASFREFSRSLRRNLLDFTIPEIALLRGEKKREAIRAQTGDVDFVQLALPFWTVAADLVSGREVVLSHGPLWQALDATSAIPAVFPPVVVDDRVLVDGWVVNPLPTDVLRREGADIVIGVDTSAGVDVTMCPTSPAGRLQRLRRRLVNPMIARVAMRAMEVGAHERTITNLALADVAVQPDLAAYSAADVLRLDEIVERGEAAADAALPVIRTALRQPGRA
jgi:NTE family protein